MMKWWKSLVRNRKGFTIVELICSIAIFSIIMTSVGSALVISARSYHNGNTELGVQQQAQIASNLLTNLIIDSDKVVQASDGKLVVEKMESGGLVTYTVELSGGELKYYSSTDSTARTLAENITGFVINRAEGENVDFSLTVEADGKSYASDYHVTPRNGISSGGEALSGTIGIFVENRLTLEPNQTYDLNVRISGTTNTGFTIDSTDGGINSPDTQITAVGSNIQIKVGSTEMDSFHFSVISDADPSVSKNVDVFIRRVNTISVNGYKTGGSGNNRAGAEYKVSATLTGDNLEKQPGAWYDVDYVDPYKAHWTYEFTKEDEDGHITTYENGKITKDEDGHITIDPISDYIEITGLGVEGNIPYVAFKLKQDLTEGCKLRITSTALHPEGKDLANPAIETNKSGLKYDTVSGFWELEYQAWRRNGRLDIGLALDDSYFWTNETPKRFKGNAELNIWAYSASGKMVDHPTGFNFFSTRDSGSFVKVEPGYGDVNTWEMVLDLTRSAGDGMAYSSPYLTRLDEWTAPYWSDVTRYDIEIWYEVDPNQSPEHASEGRVLLTSSHSIEDVQIKFRNSAYADWNRTNKVYVTTADSISDYNVYFMFDKGWEGTDYIFAALTRFVGIVHEDTDDSQDVRRDIAATGQGLDGHGNSYVTFSLSATDKEECKALAASYDGVVKEVYEYNPYFGKLYYQTEIWGQKVIGQDEWGYDIIDYNAFLGYESTFRGWPTEQAGATLQADQLNAIKGCAGAVEFHFVEPNITGATLKVMYCPTVAEYGPVYYIDDVSRFIIAAGAAQYQELVGGTWSTVVNLTWNGTNGWIAN